MGIRACGWINIRQLISTSLLAPQAIDIPNPGNFVRSHWILGFASARARSRASTEGRRSSRQHEWVSKGLQAFGRRSLPTCEEIFRADAVHVNYRVGDAAAPFGG